MYLDEDMPYIKVISKGKYREQEARTVYLTGDAAKAINEWLMFREDRNTIVDVDAVFSNKNGKRLNEDNIKAIFKNYGNGMSYDETLVCYNRGSYWWSGIYAATARTQFCIYHYQ